jgi:hypothetical protein
MTSVGVRRLFRSSAAVLLATLGCTSPTRQGDPTPTAAPTTPTAEPTTPPVSGDFCPMGTLAGTCGQERVTFGSALDAAIDRLIAKRPELFASRPASGPGQYEVLSIEEYVKGVVHELNGAGFCAESHDRKHVMIKKGNTYSERHALFTAKGYMRRNDARRYVETCRPAAFPISADEYIDYIRVGFYEIECPNGRVPPRNWDGVLPVGCTGWVTATPKTVDHRDVPPEVHGPEIRWELSSGETERDIHIDDQPQQPFNKVVTALAEGHFGLCATVKGVRGCLEVDIIR